MTERTFLLTWGYSDGRCADSGGVAFRRDPSGDTNLTRNEALTLAIAVQIAHSDAVDMQLWHCPEDADIERIDLPVAGTDADS